jgi:DNA-binding transcriptional LysR family regulator
LNADDAVRKNYIYVDWGISFSEAHSQYFQDIPTPLMRIDAGRIAKRFIKSKSGTAYLPEIMVKRDLENGELFKVKDAPEISRNAYIIYNNTNERCLSMIEQLSDQ